jgi:hypothetical protein
MKLLSAWLGDYSVNELIVIERGEATQLRWVPASDVEQRDQGIH